MKIIVRYFSSVSIGNFSTIVLFVNDDLLVSQLKEMIQKHIQIDPSFQKLTVKVCNLALVQMTNDFPLSFFHLKEKSIIFLEFLHDSKQLKSKRIVAETKSKILKSLNNIKPIMESENENNEEIRKLKHLDTISFMNSDLIQMVIVAIKSDNFDQVKELFELYSGIDVNSVGLEGKSMIHYACLSNNPKILKFLIESNCDVNKLTRDLWSPLLIACFKGGAEVVELLCMKKNINIDYFHADVGTAIHVACRRNHLKIVSILITKNPNIKIKDSDGCFPGELTSHQAIQRLVLIYSKFKENQEYRKNKQKMIANQVEFISRIRFFPDVPSITIGNLKKKGEFLFSYNNRFLEIDPFKGYLKRFRSIHDYPLNPKEIIPLGEIDKCEKIESKNKYYFEIFFKRKQIYQVHNKEVNEKWIEQISKSIIFSKFWKFVISKEPRAEEYLNHYEIDNEIYSVDDFSIELERQKEEFKAQEKNKFIEFKKRSVYIKSSRKPSFSSSSSNNSNSKKFNDSFKNKKKPRPISNKKNPFIIYTAPKVQVVKEKLIDDSVTQGINFKSFKIIEELSSGNFGKVYLVKFKETKEIYTMKMLSKKNLKEKMMLKYTISECNLMKTVKKNKFIVTLHYVFQTSDHIYMVLDYCPGGDLSFHLSKVIFDEVEAKFFISELILAVEFLHSQNLVYRDLTTDKILIDSKGHLKLSDFGITRVTETEPIFIFNDDHFEYNSPEIEFMKGHGKSADIYGIGAILYEMLSGMKPYYNDIHGEDGSEFKMKDLVIPEYFSKEVKLFLIQTLSRDPVTRIGVENINEIKKHLLFNDVNWSEIFLKKNSPPLNLVEIKELDRKMTNKAVNFLEVEVIDD